MSTQNKFTLDANTIITAWDELYPPDLFPKVWQLLIDNKEKIVFLKEIYDQIDPHSRNDDKLSPDEYKKKYTKKSWLKVNQFEVFKANNIDARALELEREYQTKLKSKGADSKDILLIAFAAKYQHTVVTLEGEQKQKPSKKDNYKIPLNLL